MAYTNIMDIEKDILDTFYFAMGQLRDAIVKVSPEMKWILFGDSVSKNDRHH